MYSLQTEELLKNLEMTERVVEQMEWVDERLYKIQRKPIRLKIWTHIFIVSILLLVIGILFLLFEMSVVVYKGPFLIDRYNIYWYIAIPVIGYPLLITLINGYGYISKRLLHREELEKLRARRLTMIEKLGGVTMIPLDYWSTSNIQAMRRYIQNKRAETLKEVLNLLEEDLRHEQLMIHLGAIRERRKQL